MKDRHGVYECPGFCLKYLKESHVKFFTGNEYLLSVIDEILIISKSSVANSLESKVRRLDADVTNFSLFSC